MALFGSQLIFPRVAVFWGNTNISLYSGGNLDGEPLVYDVSVDLGLNNNNPTGSFKWNPSGAAFDIYEEFVTQRVNEFIEVRFYYEGGKQINFQFVWAGQSIIYGNDMTITVKLRSQLDGLVNADIRSTTQNYDQAASYNDALNRYLKQYGLEKYPKLVCLNEKASQDLTKATIENAYRESETFVSAITNLVQQNGNLIFPNNVNNDVSIAVFPPFSWDKRAEAVQETTIDQSTFDPCVRYGYLLGPGIINSIERTLEWSPPQVSKEGGKAKQQIPQSRRNANGQNLNTERANQQIGQQQGAVQGTSTARPNPGIRNANNPDGPVKQRLLQQESQSKLSANVFMCPHLVGIKPGDIVYIPSLKENVPYIEDWIVESVNYQQSNGGVDVSISGTRPFTTVGLINPAAGEKFKVLALTLNKPGRAGLTAWQEFAWKTARSAQSAAVIQQFFNPRIPSQSVTSALLGGV